MQPCSKPQVRIIGGGVAGLEAALAIEALAPGLVDVTMITPDLQFIYRPLIVEEPFTGKPAPRFELAPLLADAHTVLLGGSLQSVDCSARTIELTNGAELSYDALLVCVGAHSKPAYADVHTFPDDSEELRADELIRDGIHSRRRQVSLVVPPGTSWPLPLYELALMLRVRSRQVAGAGKLKIRLLTPEQAPLMVFGKKASDAVSELLEVSEIDVEAGVHVVDSPVAEPHTARGNPLPTEGPVISLPCIVGSAIAGLPADPHGFIPIGAGCEVLGCEDVYAAGDGTTFPIKQGGLATQQADAAAERIVAGLGAKLDPAPFRPVLRGKLLTGAAPMHLLSDRAAVGPKSIASAPSLWWPPAKISGRYLTDALGIATDADPPNTMLPIEVEVSLPVEWHSEPMLPRVAG